MQSDNITATRPRVDFFTFAIKCFISRRRVHLTSLCMFMRRMSSCTDDQPEFVYIIKLTSQKILPPCMNEYVNSFFYIDSYEYRDSNTHY